MRKTASGGLKEVETIQATGQSISKAASRASATLRIATRRVPVGLKVGSDAGSVIATHQHFDVDRSDRDECEAPEHADR